MSLRLPVASVEYVKCKVSAREAGVPINVTAGTVEWQATTVGATSSALLPGGWIAGSWETAGDGVYYARVLLSTLALGVGSYQLWLRIANSPETPVRDVGKLILS